MKCKVIGKIICAALWLLGSSAVASTTWYVNGLSGSDGNNCTSPTTACKTIGHAISLASSGDSIRVAAATYTENLFIGISLNVIGFGAKSTVIDGGGVRAVIFIDGTRANVTISKVTIRNGYGVWGGGIENWGTLTINNSTITSNRAARLDVFAGLGGGVYSSGTLIINSSTISGNSATDAGGGIYILRGRAMIDNSTISENETPGAGGGIYNGHTVGIFSSTISENRGGGIRNIGTATLKNSIVANSSFGGNCSGIITHTGYDLSSDSTCSFSNTGDLNNTDPMLGPLQNNGGPTQTQALLSGSPAIDAGNPNGCTDGQGQLLTTDQRGKPRPDTEDTGGCDIGAYERQSD